jgi:hypothetical protein
MNQQPPDQESSTMVQEILLQQFLEQGGTDFSTEENNTFTVGAKKSYSLNVIFKPTPTGLKTAILAITSNDADTPTLDIPVSETGQ